MGEIGEDYERLYIGTLLSEQEKDILFDLGFLEHDSKEKDDYISSETLSCNEHIRVFLNKIKKDQKEGQVLWDDNQGLRRKNEVLEEEIVELKKLLSKILETSKGEIENIKKILKHSL